MKNSSVRSTHSSLTAHLYGAFKGRWTRHRGCWVGGWRIRKGAGRGVVTGWVVLLIVLPYIAPSVEKEWRLRRRFPFVRYTIIFWLNFPLSWGYKRNGWWVGGTTKWHLIYADTENKLLSQVNPESVYLPKKECYQKPQNWCSKCIFLVFYDGLSDWILSKKI